MNTKRTRHTLSAFLLASSTLLGCSEEAPYSPNEEAADWAVKCEHEVQFQQDDPNDYEWTVKVVDMQADLVIDGSSITVPNIKYRFFPKASVAETGGKITADTVNLFSGEIAVHRDLAKAGSFVRPNYGLTGRPEAILARGVSYDDLINGSFQFLTATPNGEVDINGCVKQLDYRAAIESINDLSANTRLETNYYPERPETTETDPFSFFAGHFRQDKSLIMMVDSVNPTTPNPCNDPTTEGTADTRSLISWMAVRLEATPKPELIDPFVRDGVDFHLEGQDEAGANWDYCNHIPEHFLWKVNAYAARTKIADTTQYPNGAPIRIKVEIPGGGVVQSSDVQVDPGVDDEGVILTNFNYVRDPRQLEDGVEIETVAESPFEELIWKAEQPSNSGLRFKIQRYRDILLGDDSDLDYASCTAKLTRGHMEFAYAGNFLQIVKDNISDDPETSRDETWVNPSYDPANPSHVPATCSDPSLPSRGLQYLVVEMGLGQQIDGLQAPRPPRLVGPEYLFQDGDELNIVPPTTTP